VASIRASISPALPAIFQADSFAGFNELYRQGAVGEVGCWAHCGASSSTCTPTRPSHLPAKIAPFRCQIPLGHTRSDGRARGILRCSSCR
jgi:hypothetical protein